MPNNPCKTREVDTAFRVVRMRVYPTDVQEQRQETWMESLRWLYNRCLRERKEVYSNDKTTLTFKEQKDALVALKKECPDLKSVPSGSVQDCVKRLQESYNHFFRRVKERKQGSKVKAGYPRFKKYGSYRSLTYPQAWVKKTDKKTKQVTFYETIKLRVPDGVSLDVPAKEFKSVWGTLTLPKLGEVKIRVHRPIDWREARSVTLKKMPNGHWYVCVCMQVQMPNPKEEEQEKTGGVDLGLKALATTSDGDSFPHPRCLRESEEKLKDEQRKLSRKEKGSNNWEKQRQKVASIHHKIKNQRRDFLHKLSFWLVSTYTLIAFEDLNIPGMVRCRNFAKSILDAGWGTLITMTTYKSVMRGGYVVKVDPKYTTQDCSRCGHRVPKALSERIHKCSKCGLELCRDQNAAINIKNRVGMGLSPGCGSG